MAMDLTWILKADDKASPVFDKLKSNATQATDGVSMALSTVGKGVNGFIGIWGTLAGVVAGGAAFKAIISETVAWTGEAVKLSKALGITTEQASVLNVALGDVYLTYEDMLAANSRIVRSLSKNEEAFKALGVATREQNGDYRSSMDVMTDVNSKLSKIKEGTDRNVAATSIYGKGWQEVSGILKLNAEVMKEAQEKAEKLHLIIGPDGVDKVKKYKAMMNDIEDVHKSIVVQIGTQLLPMLTEMGVAFGNVGVEVASGTKPIMESMHALFAGIRGGVVGKAQFGKSFFSNLMGGMSLKESASEAAAELTAYNQMVDRTIGNVLKGETVVGKEGAKERYQQEQKLNKEKMELMDKELAAHKAHAEQLNAIDKARTDVRLAQLQGDYAKGLLTTGKYYDGEEQIAMKSARAKIKILRDYLAEEDKLLKFTQEKMGGNKSPEYQAELAKHEKAVGELKLAEIDLDKISLELGNKKAEALRKENEYYSEQVIKTMELAEKYVAAELEKQAATRRTVDYQRLELEVLSGNADARKAMFAIWRQQGSSRLEAEQKETEALRAHERALKDLDDEINKLLGTYQEETAEQRMLREEKEKLEPLEKRLAIAKKAGADMAVERLEKEIDATQRLMLLKKNSFMQELAINAYKQSLLDAQRVLSGEVVGWSGNTAILANGGTAFVNGVSAGDTAGIGLYTSYGQQATNPDGSKKVNYWGEAVDAKGNVLNPYNLPLVGSYAVGTSYVPRDGLAYLHKGEAVIPASQNSGPASMVVSIGDIIVQGGASGTETAREIARAIYPELQKLTGSRLAVA